MKKIVIYKIGGKVINDPSLFQCFLGGLADQKGLKIVVHGGGNKASEVMNRLGEKPKMIEGRRITDATALEIVTMVYGGLINKNIVAQMQSKGINAIGLSGADGNIINSRKREVKKIDFGYVGDVEKVDGEMLKSLCSLGLVPVICALTHDNNGQMLNTNADTIATEIAKALSQTSTIELVFCFELKGVLTDFSDPLSVISTLKKNEMKAMHKSGIINDGMIPKLSNGFDALEGGVSKVSIRHIEEMNIENAGTTLCL